MKVRVEEYTMDFMDDNKRSLTNVKILHRPIDDTYFGQLYIDKQGQIKGSTSTYGNGFSTLIFIYFSEVSVWAQNNRPNDTSISSQRFSLKMGANQ